MPKPKKTPKPKTAKASAKSLATPAAPEDNGEKLIDHITALRKGLMHIFLAIVVLFPVGYWLAPQCIDFLVMWCFPPELGTLNYFSPMEVFVTRLKMGAIFAVILGYPYIIRQVWEFVLPALYDKERKALGLFIFWSALLFFIGVAFCAAFILPLVMKFSAGFATESLKPMLRLNDFLVLCGGLTLAFGLMFQFPLVMFLAVHFSKNNHTEQG